MKKLFITIIILIVAVNSFSQSIDTAQVSVNFSNTEGTFTDYLFSTGAEPFQPSSFIPANFALAKTCGFKVMEIGFQMPIPLDANDSTQYNFSALDQSVNPVIYEGFEPFLVLGQPNIKPTNLNNYSTFIKNVIRHYTQGWNNGYYYNLKIVRWGNEPDFNMFWSGTQQEFFETYAAVSNAVKSLDSTIIIDTPGFAFPASWSGNTRILSPWITNFLSYCQINNVKVDILTIHAYAPITYHSFYSDLTLINNALSAYPSLSNIYGTPKLGSNEWSTMIGNDITGSYHAEFDSAWAAAHDIIGLSAMIKQGVFLSLRYGGTFNNSVPSCYDFLLTDCNGIGKPSYFAFKGFNMLAGDSIVQTTGSDYINFSDISGKQTDTVTLVLSNFDALTYLNRFETTPNPWTTSDPWTDYNNYVADFGTPAVYEYARIAVNNLPWVNDSIKVLHYLVDDNNDLALINTSSFGGTSNLSFTAPMTVPSVHLFKIIKETITGIEVQPGQNNYVNIFPNPSNGKFTVLLNTQYAILNTQIEIYNVLGEIVFQSEIKNPKSEIDLSVQPTGMYFYQVKNNKQFISSGKIIIQQ